MPLSILTKVAPLAMSDALVYALAGFAIVFVVLIAIMLVTKVLGSMFGRKKTKEILPDPTSVVVRQEESRKIVEPAVKEIPAGMALAPGSIGELKLHTVDDKSAALIMAIVADSMQCPLNELRFISIKEI